MVVAGSRIGIETWVGKAAVSVAAVAAAAVADLDLHDNLHYLGTCVQVGPGCSLADFANSVQ
jgi:hypothetical protein